MDFIVGKNTVVSENTGLKGDKVAEDVPLKYYTSNWYNNPSPENGVNFHEGFGISQGFIDTESSLSRGQITNPRVRQDLGSYPVITGGLPYSGPEMSGEISNQFKSCDSHDGLYHDRHFYTLREHPNHVQSGFDFRQGVDTRMDTKVVYRR
jgi:hypothetical protein